MKKALDRKLRSARLRLGVNLLLEQLALCLAIAGAAVLVAVLVERVFAFGVAIRWYYIAVSGSLGAAAIVALVLWVVKLPGKMATAILIDERLALRERFSTALAFADSDDPFAQAACREAHESTASARIRDRFPVRPTRRWGVAGLVWLAFVGAWFLDPLDVLGKEAARNEVEEVAMKAAEDKDSIKAQIERIAPIVKQLGDPKLEQDLKELTRLLESGKLSGLKRDAVRRIGDLADKLKEAKSGQKMQAANQLRDMLRNLRSNPKGLDNRLNQALARGKFGEAARQLKDLQQKLEAGQLSPEDLEKLSQQLADLAEQIDRAAQDKKALEDALADAGMAKKMSGMSEDDLRKALKDAGLSEEEIEKIMQAMKACQNASQTCQGLSKQMGRAGQQGQSLTPDELAQLVSQLSDMQLMQSKLGMLQQALSECEMAGMCLGEGEAGEDMENAGLMLSKQGGKGKPKGMLKMGSVMGPGRATGDRPMGPDEKTNTTKTGVKNTAKPADPIASWFVKGTQVKGEARQTFKDVAQTASQQAAEAITENRIPPRYHSAVKEYFDTMEKKSE